MGKPRFSSGKFAAITVGTTVVMATSDTHPTNKVE